MDILECREGNTRILDFTKQSWRDDITFVVEGKPLFASKCVLSLYSPVFEKMFDSNFKEKESTEIELPGEKAEDFIEFLQCLYPASKVSVTEVNVRQVLPLADEYQVATLTDECKNIIRKNMSNTEADLTSRNLVEYYESVTRHGLKEQSKLFVDEIVRQGNYDMTSIEAENLLTKDALVELQKNIISKQEERLDEVTTQFVKLCMKTKGQTSEYIRAFENAKGTVIECNIDDVFDSKLLDKVYSRPVKLWTVSFRISVSVRHGTLRGQTDKYLSVYLECNFPDEDAGWSCDIEGDIILENTSTDKNCRLTSQGFTCQLISESSKYGYENFETLSKFLSGTEKAVEKYSCKVSAYILAKDLKKTQ